MRSLTIVTACILLTAYSRADWPRLRGAQGDGKAEGSLPTTWSDTENLQWKTPLPGPGSSSPIIVGDKVFLTCWSGYADGSSDDMKKMVRHLLCINKSEGKILWDKVVPAVQPEDFANGMLMEHGYASSTPVSDGTHVYVFFGKTGVLAFDLQGKQLWQTSVGTQSNRKGWGSASSPILHNDTVIITAYDEGGAMVALDKKTGAQVWRAPAEGLHTVYSTPLISGEDLILPVANEVWGINPESGKLRWFASYKMGGNISPGVTVAEGTLFVTGGYPTAGTVAFKLGGKGDITASNALWNINTASYIPTPIYHEGHLYVVNDAGFAMCIEAKTGKEIYRERVMENSAGGSGGRRGGGKPFYASPVLVGGNLYAPSRKNGVFVIAAKPTYQKIAKNTFASDSSQMNGTPAVDGNRLYLRSDKALYCIGK